MTRTPKKSMTEKILETQRHTLRNLVASSGGQKQVAETLGVTQAAVSKWCVQGFVPLRRAVEIEAVFGIPRAQTANPRLTQAFAPTEFEAV